VTTSRLPRIPARIALGVGLYDEAELARIATGFFQAGSGRHEEIAGMHLFWFTLTSWTQVPALLDLAFSGAGQLGLDEVGVEIAGIEERFALR
jgi:hypothetical protein